MIKKLKLKDKFKQFLVIFLLFTNEVNFQLNQINSNYYNYATFADSNQIENSKHNSTNLTLIDTNNQSRDEITFLKNICNLEISKIAMQQEICLVTLIPSAGSFNIEHLSLKHGVNLTDFKSLIVETELNYENLHKQYLTLKNINTIEEKHSNSGYTCQLDTLYDHTDVTLFNPITKYLIRKLITKNEFNKFKIDYFNLLNNTTKSDETNDLIEQTVVSPMSSTFISSDKMKFVYNIETDRISDLNSLYKKYLNILSGDDHLISLSLIQDKFTYNFFLHLRTKSGKSYLNQLFPGATLTTNNYYFKFKKTNTFLLRLKSVEFYNIIKYEIYSPLTSNCTASSYNEPLPSSYLNCDHFNELAFYQEIQQREPYRKYKEIQSFIINDNIHHNNYDPFKCILTEYFGKIFTCDGRLLNADEFIYLSRNKSLKYYGLLVLYQGKNLLLKMDFHGNVPEYKDAINPNLIPNSNSFLNNNQQICHECAKIDLRAKVETSKAHNQYREAIKIRNEKYEKIFLLFLIFIVLSIFWLKNNNKKY